MSVLPAPIIDEIFDLRYKPGDMAIGHLCDDLEGLGLRVKEVVNHDHAVIILFDATGDHPTDGEIRVDRVRQVFDVSAVVDSELVLPVSGGWETVLDCIRSFKS